MKLEDTRSIYNERSAKASDVSRQLALGGLAVIWIFKTDLGGAAFSVPHDLGQPAFLMMVVLSLDLLQYTVAALAWGLFNRHMEKKLEEARGALESSGKAPPADYAQTEEFSAPRYINWAALALFWGKLAVLAGGYYYLFSFVVTRITH
jgi:hypothetical protein